MGNKQQQQTDTQSSHQTSATISAMPGAEIQSGATDEMTGESLSGVSYATVKIDQRYLFTYEPSTDSYIAEIPELRVKVIIPPTHYYRQPDVDSWTNNMFIQEINEWLSVKDNVIAEQIAFFDKDPKASIADVLQEKYNVPSNIPECKFVAWLTYGDVGLMQLSDMEFYTMDIDAFANSKFATPGHFMGGAGDICGEYARNITRIYYSPSYPDRYVQSMVSFQSVELLNGGTYIEFTD